MTWTTPVSIFSIPRPLCSRVTPEMCDRQETDRRQTDGRQTKASLNAPPPIRGGGIISVIFGALLLQTAPSVIAD